MQTLTIPLREGGFTVIYWYGETGKYFSEIGIIPENKTVIRDKQKNYILLTDKEILMQVGGWTNDETDRIIAYALHSQGKKE